MEHDLGNPYTNNVFQEAVEHNDIAVVKTLLRFSIFLRRNQRNRNRLTALQQSVLDGNGRMTILLLENGSDIEAKTSNGWTCLHIAAALGDVDILTTLINHCASLLALTKDEELPIDLAATREVKIKLAKEMSRIGYSELAQWYMKKLAAEKGGFYILSATTLLDLACDDSYNSVSLYECGNSIDEHHDENEGFHFGKEDIEVDTSNKCDILVNEPPIASPKCSSKSSVISSENSPSHKYLETAVAESKCILPDDNSLDKDDYCGNVLTESGTNSHGKSIDPINSIVLNIDYCNLVDQDDGEETNDAEGTEDLCGFNPESDVEESMIYLFRTGEKTNNSGKSQHQKITEHSSTSPQTCSENTSRGSCESFPFSQDTSNNSKGSLQSLSDSYKLPQPAPPVFYNNNTQQNTNWDKASQISSSNGLAMQYNSVGVVAQNNYQTPPVDIPVHYQAPSCGVEKHISFEAEDAANDFCNCPNCKKLGYALSPDIGAISPGAVRVHLERQQDTMRSSQMIKSGAQLQRSQTVQGRNVRTRSYQKDRKGDQAFCYSKSHLHKPRKRKKKLFSGIKSMFKDTIKAQQRPGDEPSVVVDDAGISVAFVFQDRRKVYGLKGDVITRGNDSFSRCTSPYCSEGDGSHTIFHKNPQQQGNYNNNTPINQEPNRNQVRTKGPTNLSVNCGQHRQQNEFHDHVCSYHSPVHRSQSAREERASEFQTSECRCRTIVTDQLRDHSTSPRNGSNLSNMMSQIKVQDDGAALQQDSEESNDAFLSPLSLRRDRGR